jgi:hypothetical protein
MNQESKYFSSSHRRYIMQPCSQEQNLKEIQKDVQLSKERDVLQSEQIINMQKDITNINTKVDKLDIKMDK